MTVGAVILAASLTAVVGTLALFAVFVFWSAPTNSSDALPYFAVPGALFGVAAALGYRAWHLDQHR